MVTYKNGSIGPLIKSLLLCFLFSIITNFQCVVHAQEGGKNPVPLYTYKVKKVYPHDPKAFTQGLIYDGGFLYEGTGQYGASSLRKVDLETGKVLKMRGLPPQYFGEGIALFRDRIIQLTWQSRVGFVYHKERFELIREFSYPTEGWGLTTDGRHIIMSDGSSTLSFLDPESFKKIKAVEVRDPFGLVSKLNELEYIRGEIFANIWPTNRIARIAPATGMVTGWIDMTGLAGPDAMFYPIDVLNGIAYDAGKDRLFVTGKLWPKLYEIQLINRPEIK